MPQSPKARPSKANPTMDFPEAMKAIIAGKKVTREGWNNTDYIYLEKPGFLKIHFSDKDEKDGALLVSDGDMLNDDWVVVNFH